MKSSTFLWFLISDLSSIAWFEEHCHEIVTSVTVRVLDFLSESEPWCKMMTLLSIDSPQTVSDTQLGEEVHEEGTVEVLAHLIEHKPVSQFAVIYESPDLVHLC